MGKSHSPPGKRDHPADKPDYSVGKHNYPAGKPDYPVDKCNYPTGKRNYPAVFGQKPGKMRVLGENDPNLTKWTGFDRPSRRFAPSPSPPATECFLLAEQ